MHHRVLALAAVVAGSLGTAGIAGATPGPNGHNDYGLCTAYSAGSANGQSHKHDAGPFVALEQAADQAGNKDGTASPQEIVSYCSSKTPGGK